MRTVYNDHDRFEKVYFSKFPACYVPGDGCYRDKDGYYWITGRIDDMMNVSGTVCIIVLYPKLTTFYELK